MILLQGALYIFMFES